MNKTKKKLIHCITNPISVTLCANGILALGHCPMMAEHEAEVEEITKGADALLLNLGNITDMRMRSMKIAGYTAKNKGIPIVLDAVGVACSQLRRNYAKELIPMVSPSVVKGNYSEIQALFNENYGCCGVDAEPLSLEETETACRHLAKHYRCIFLASGKTDIITDGERVLYVNRGTPRLGEITGTGCLQGALIACFLAEQCVIDAVGCACTFLGVCGEAAAEAKGNGSFATMLLDYLSDTVLQKRIKEEFYV